MVADDSHTLDFVDALLGALGLKSITTKPGAAEGAEEPGLLQTGIYGRSHFSFGNREVMREALLAEPRPSTLGALAAALEGGAASPEREEILSATRAELERNGDRGLQRLIREHRA